MSCFDRTRCTLWGNKSFLMFLFFRAMIPSYIQLRLFEKFNEHQEKNQSLSIASPVSRFKLFIMLGVYVKAHSTIRNNDFMVT